MNKINYDKYEVIKNINRLKLMEKRGLIKFCNQTGTKIKALYSDESFICTYIDEAPFLFEFEGEMYGQKYFSGCFYPYVVKYKTY